MIIEITMKTPNILDSIKKQVESNIISELLDYEKEEFLENQIEKAKELSEKWFKYEEYLTVEIDTEKETCIVKEAK